MLPKFLRWLKGYFTCERCGREFFVNTFGFGTSICPDCYSGERNFIFLDSSYWLNRILRFRTNGRFLDSVKGEISASKDHNSESSESGTIPFVFDKTVRS